MEKTYTPGPWRFNEYLAQNLKRYQIINTDCVVLLEIQSRSKIGESEANAHLIAAAPDLLEACTALLIMALEYDLHGPVTELAQSAISKALNK